MPLVLGLGNPGSRYAHTRHNAGFRVVAALVGRWGAEPRESVAEYRAWVTRRGGREVHLVEPLTFMNRSGEALEAWRGRHALDVAAMLVVVDDVYLPIGLLRLRCRGSSGGHRGLESVEAVLGTRDYARLRVGVGAAESSAVLREHVLEEFEGEEQGIADEIVTRAADAVECWLEEGLLAAMNRFNRKAVKEVQEP